MAKITDVTKNEEYLIIVWESQEKNYITYFEPNVTPQEIRTKISQLEDGFEIPGQIENMIGSEF
jgi:hypothetical protein